jgi:hypothetical protein
MMRSIILPLILCRCLAYGQTTKEDYTIYSQYLKAFQTIKAVKKINFVVRESAECYSRGHDTSEINDYAKKLRAALKGDKAALQDVYFMFRSVIETFHKDTLWIPVIAELGRKMKRGYKIQNKFSPDLQTSVIDDHSYKKYFGNIKHIDKSWNRFHKQYPMPSALTELSEIAGDGQRAVFYFSWRCGGLCGDGDLVFLYKENNEWKYLGVATLWYN